MGRKPRIEERSDRIKRLKIEAFDLEQEDELDRLIEHQAAFLCEFKDLQNKARTIFISTINNSESQSITETIVSNHGGCGQNRR